MERDSTGKGVHVSDSAHSLSSRVHYAILGFIMQDIEYKTCLPARSEQCEERVHIPMTVPSASSVLQGRNSEFDQLWN